ncbi:MAG TPA: WYL domain-containing protein [Flavipsychrobacter sp.]|nr:WYL domain-containing protein [Flavipsychrobacter sp.]
MPINKSAHYRFEIIDECLRNTMRKWSKAELLKFINRRLELHFGEGVSISLSQLRYDLESMKTEFDAPIELYKDGRNVYYRYEDQEFSIRTIPLREEDILKLNDAVKLLQQIRGFTIADEMADIVNRLENRYKLVNTKERSVISFESSPSMQGVENLEDIYHAIIQNKVLKIDYKAFHASEARTWHIHPYLLKEYTHRWYLLGFAEEKNCMGVFALDRMKSIKVCRNPYKANTDINSNDYFSDVMGVTVLPNQSAEEIILEFSPKLSPYILTKPVHHSQRILSRSEKGELTVSLSLVINPELLNTILSYRYDVKVLQPQHLINEIKATASQLMALYSA